MSFTQNKYSVPSTSGDIGQGTVFENKDGVYTEFSTEGKTFINGKAYTQEELEERLRKDNLFAEQDYNIIIKVFEVETSNWQREDYAVAYHYKDVYSTRNFSARVREQMSFYPGMHQITDKPDQDPFYRNAKEQSEQRLDHWDQAMDSPTSFMDGLRARKQDFDYTKIFGSNVEAKEKAKELGHMFVQCVPCFGRVLDPNELLPDGDLLEIHALNIKVRTDLLDQLNDLFNGPGLEIDICEILKLLSSICPQDLLAMATLLSQFLAKLNLDIKFNLDFILELVGPILSPFLDAIGDWLDMWIQLILEPMICVIDHVNEVIITAQQAKIPFSQVSGSISSDIGIASPSNPNIPILSKLPGNVSNQNVSGFSFNAIEDTAGVGTANSLDVFQTPDSQKYNPTIPEYPTEELDLAAQEVRSVKKAAAIASTEDVTNAFSPGVSEKERNERDARWAELRAKQNAKEYKVPAPLRQVNEADGTRWSKDDIPESEKYSHNMDWQAGSYHPPERQTLPKSSGTEYFVTTPLVSGIVQLRNVMQGAIEYVRDWFTYITQMIYDLLGTDIGWMQKKTDTTILKSRIIQIIGFIVAILEAIEKNGLECGVDSNFDVEQLRFITENVLSKMAGVQYTVLDDGTVKIDPHVRQPSARSEKDTSKENVTAEAIDRQEAIDSSIIIKTCFKDVSADELARARNWIADFEERGGS